MKFIMSEPKVSFKEQASGTSTEYIRVVEKDPESKVIEFSQVSKEFLENLEKLKNKCKTQDVFLGSEVLLSDWIEPYTDLCFGVKPHVFFIKFVEKNMSEAEPETLVYSDLKLSISLMKFLGFENQNIVENFEKRVEKTYP